MRTKKFDDIELWRGRIRLAELYQKPHRERWTRFKNYYLNKYWEGQGSNADRISVNYVFSNIQTMLPSIYSRNPYILIQARTPESIENAKLTELVINYQLKEINFKETMLDVLLDALIFGIGYIKLGYKLETETEKLKNKEGKVEFNEFIKNEEVFANRVSPYDVFIPREAKSDTDIPYVAIKVVKSYEDVIHDRRYENLKGLKPTAKVIADNEKDAMENIYQRYGLKEDQERVILYEIWDKRSGRMGVIAEGHNKWLKNIKNPYDIEGLPLCALRFNIVPDDFYPVPDILEYEPQQLEKNELRTQMLIMFKRLSRKFLVPETMEDYEIENLKSSEDAAIVKLADPESVKILEQAFVSPDTFNLDGIVDRDINILSAVNEYQRMPQRRKTATEASISESISKSRMSRRIDQIDDFVGKVARKLIQLDRQFYDKKRVLKIAGDKGEIWVNYDKKNLQGEFDINIQAGSSAPVDKELRIRQLLDVWNLGSKALDQNGKPIVDKRKLLKMILQEFNVESESVLLKPTETPPAALPPQPGMSVEPDIKQGGGAGGHKLEDLLRKARAGAGLSQRT